MTNYRGQKYKLDDRARAFVDLEQLFIEEDGTRITTKFLCTLWVAQEILKQLPVYANWDQDATKRPEHQNSRWDDKEWLRAQTSRNTNLLDPARLHQKPPETLGAESSQTQTQEHSNVVQDQKPQKPRAADRKFWDFLRMKKHRDRK